MYLNIKILLVIGSAIGFYSCVKNDNFEDIPVLNFEEYVVFKNNQNTVDSASFKFSFKDGDGDLGSLDSDDFNCFLIYEEKYGDSSVNFSDIANREYRLPKLTPNSRDKNIEGSVILILKPAPIFNVFSDSAYRYTCYLIDRAGNPSNNISTDWNEKY